MIPTKGKSPSPAGGRKTLHRGGAGADASQRFHNQRRKKKNSPAPAHRSDGRPASCNVIYYHFALALELLTLGSPLLNQLVIDEVLVDADRGLLSVIIIALILLSLTQMLLSLARQWASITLSVNFNMQWTARVFHHLVGSPVMV